jgi:hypothetical protein
VQTLPTYDNRSSERIPTNTNACRLHAGTDGVARWQIRIPGWKDPTGYALNVEFGDIEEVLIHGKSLWYQRYTLPEFRLSHVAYLMVLQGLELSKLVSGILSQTIIGDDGQIVTPIIVPGPWVLLRGKLSPPWAIPTLRNVLLVRLLEAPEKAVANELLLHLSKKFLPEDLTG